MSVRARNAAIAAAVVLLIALIVVWWNATFERVARTVDLPPRGEPTYNPLYLLKIALGHDGVRVTSRQRLQLDQVPLGRRDTVLILNDPRTLADADVDALLRWAEHGGHLVVRVPPGDGAAGRLFDALDLQAGLDRPDCTQVTDGAAVNAAAKTVEASASASSTGAADDAVVPSLDRDDAAALSNTSRQHKPDASAAAPSGLFCPGAQFDIGADVEPLLAWGDDDEDGYAYARLQRGEGTVDVLGDLDMVTNDHLAEALNAAIVRRLLAPGWRTGVVHLIYDASLPPLWRLLLDNAWMIWLPLLIAFALWLWMRTQRFGPLAPAPEADRRALLEHVQASGEHLWRYGRANLLHTAVRDAFMTRLRRRDPLAAALDGAAQAAAIAARTGSNVADVTAALQPPQRLDAREFFTRIARLIQLRQRL